MQADFTTGCWRERRTEHRTRDSSTNYMERAHQSLLEKGRSDYAGEWEASPGFEPERLTAGMLSAPM